MKKQRLIFLSLFGFIILSCQKKISEETTKNNLADFDYLQNISFDLSLDELQKEWPIEMKKISDNEDGTMFQMTKHNIKHDISILFYGFETFEALTLEIDFSKNLAFQKTVYDHLLNQLTKKYQAPTPIEDLANNASYTWLVGKTDEALQNKITLSSSEHIINIIFIK